jgi:transposase
MFQDEARFGRINAVRRCWAPSGIRPQVGYQIIREYTYVYAAVSPFDGVMDSLILPETNAYAMSLFLKEVSRRHSDEYIVMIMDKAAWHTAHILETPENIAIKFLPPYSPQLNPVENIWEVLREKWFKNQVFKSQDAVEERLVEALVILENDTKRVASIAGFDWIVSTPLIAT